MSPCLFHLQWRMLKSYVYLWASGQWLASWPSLETASRFGNECIPLRLSELLLVEFSRSHAAFSSQNSALTQFAASSFGFHLAIQAGSEHLCSNPRGFHGAILGLGDSWRHPVKRSQGIPSLVVASACLCLVNRMYLQWGNGCSVQWWAFVVASP